MSILSKLYGAYSDFKHSSPPVKQFNHLYDHFDKLLPIDHLRNGIIHLICDYYVEENGKIDKEMSRIFLNESWAWPFSSPENQRFANRFVTHITSLTISSDSMPFVAQITQRIRTIPALFKVIFNIENHSEEDKKLTDFYKSILKQNSKLRHIEFDSPLSCSLLEKVTSDAHSLESISIQELKREAGPAEADRKERQDQLIKVFSRFPNLLICKINNAALTDHELQGICRACPQIQHLDIASNKLTQDSLSIINRTLSNLKVINISKTSIKTSDLVGLALFQGLTTLVMQTFSCKFGLAPDRWSTYVSPQLTPAIIHSISSISSLVELDIRGWRISPQDFDYVIKKLTNLHTFYFGAWHCKEQPIDCDNEYDEEACLNPISNLSEPYHELFDKYKRERPHLKITFSPNYSWDVEKTIVSFG